MHLTFRKTQVLQIDYFIFFSSLAEKVANNMSGVLAILYSSQWSKSECAPGIGKSAECFLGPLPFLH